MAAAHHRTIDELGAESSPALGKDQVAVCSGSNREARGRAAGQLLPGIARDGARARHRADGRVVARVDGWVRGCERIASSSRDGPRPQFESDRDRCWECASTREVL